MIFIAVYIIIRSINVLWGNTRSIELDLKISMQNHKSMESYCARSMIGTYNSNLDHALGYLNRCLCISQSVLRCITVHREKSLLNVNKVKNKF